MPIDVLAADHRRLAAHGFSTGRRLLIMLLNFLPMTHVTLVLAVLLWPWAGLSWRAPCAAATLFLLPPLLALAAAASLVVSRWIFQKSLQSYRSASS